MTTAGGGDDVDGGTNVQHERYDDDYRTTSTISSSAISNLHNVTLHIYKIGAHFFFIGSLILFFCKKKLAMNRTSPFCAKPLFTLNV